MRFPDSPLGGVQPRLKYRRTALSTTRGCSLCSSANDRIVYRWFFRACLNSSKFLKCIAVVLVLEHMMLRIDIIFDIVKYFLQEIFMDTWGDRLRIERERLELNQTKLAQLVEISRQSQVSYEKSEGNPSGRYWESVSKLGMDVQFIFTSKRSVNLDSYENGEIAQWREADIREMADTLEMIRLLTDRGISILTRKKKVKTKDSKNKPD